MKKLAKVLEVIGIVALAVVICLTGFMLISPLFGWEAHKVLSSSMEPTLKAGGMVITKPVKLEDVEAGDHEERTGDIIAFLDPVTKEEKAHRVVDIVVLDDRLWFQTWGDANEGPDVWYEDGNEHHFVSSEGDTIKKIYFHVPYLGFLAGFMETRLAFVAMLIIPGVILVVWFSRDLRRGILDEREKRRAEAALAGVVVQGLGEEALEQEMEMQEPLVPDSGAKKKKERFPTIP